MRAFIALDVDDAARASLARLSTKLEAGAPKGARMTPADQLHLTLKFLGDIEDPAPLIDALPSLAARAPRLRAKALDAFPTLGRARVLVAAIEEDAELDRLQRAVEEASAAIGIPREARAYRPHITLARLREERDVRGWASARVELDTRASALVLYESAAEYVARARVSFEDLSGPRPN